MPGASKPFVACGVGAIGGFAYRVGRCFAVGVRLVTHRRAAVQRAVSRLAQYSRVPYYAPGPRMSRKSGLRPAGRPHPADSCWARSQYRLPRLTRRGRLAEVRAQLRAPSPPAPSPCASETSPASGAAPVRYAVNPHEVTEARGRIGGRMEAQLSEWHLLAIRRR